MARSSSLAKKIEAAFRISLVSSRSFTFRFNVLISSSWTVVGPGFDYERLDVFVRRGGESCGADPRAASIPPKRRGDA